MNCQVFLVALAAMLLVAVPGRGATVSEAQERDALWWHIDAGIDHPPKLQRYAQLEASSFVVNAGMSWRLNGPLRWTADLGDAIFPGISSDEPETGHTPTSHVTTLMLGTEAQRVVQHEPFPAGPYLQMLVGLAYIAIADTPVTGGTIRRDKLLQPAFSVAAGFRKIPRRRQGPSLQLTVRFVYIPDARRGVRLSPITAGFVF